MSDIVVYDWTWHNPPGFDNPRQSGPKFLLYMQEMRLRVDLWTLVPALTKHDALKIGQMRVRGLCFNTTRNSRGSLNLWQILDLPDNDVNVKSFASQAAKYGGLQEGNEEAADGAQIVPLPAVSTAATRAAARYWRPEWGEQPLDEGMDAPVQPSRARWWRHWRTGRKPSNDTAGGLASPLILDPEAGSGDSGNSFVLPAAAHAASPSTCSPVPHAASAPTAACPQRPGDNDADDDISVRYVEYPIGDPRRRPRWGVPIRFDIAQLQLMDTHLWVLDLLTMDTHASSQNMPPEKKQIDVHFMNITRSRLEAGDARRSGSQDGVRGVYLGELIWVIVAEVIPIILKRSPYALSRTAAMAAAYAMKDGAKRLGAKMFEATHKTGHVIKEAFRPQIPKSPMGFDRCVVQVHLMGGRQVTRKGMAVNSHALIELESASGELLATGRSEPQMWTKVPHWDQSFELYGATSTADILRILLYHQKSRQVVGLTTSSKEVPTRFIGEVTLSLKNILIKDPVIIEGGEVVGWFPLTDARGMRQGILCTGELKLGLRIINSHILLGFVGVQPSPLSRQPPAQADFAIVR